jgi:hypothetical protein
MLPDAIMLGCHSPAARIDQLQERLPFRTGAGDATHDGHLGPTVIGSGEGMMVSHDDPIPSSFVIAWAGRKVRTVIVIERTILHVQPQLPISDFFLYEDSP